MTTALREPRSAAPSRARTEWRTFRRSVTTDRMLAWLALVALLVGVAVFAWPGVVPLSALMVPMVLGSLLLGPRHLPWFVVSLLILLVLAVTRQRNIDVRTVLAIVVVFLLGFIILMMSFRRSTLGVAGTLGESMLVDLRDRIQGQGGVPALPQGWYAESALRSAGGTPFAGDFVVASHPRPDRLEVAVVDVSGKGQQAGTRALLLSGAFGGLLGALAPAEFLPAANDYLLRQDWEEGFATAIHLSLDLATGEFEVRTAGHPPAAQLAAGSGRWTVLEAEGPVLGLIEDAEFTCVSGRMRQGDAVLLYTDGLVETPDRDIALGIDRMLGQSERLLRGRFEHGAERLIEALGSRNDDSALLLVHRR